MSALFFDPAASLSVVAAFLVVNSRNPLRGAMSLLAVVVLVSLQFLLLRAPFVAIAHLMAYGGVLLLLFVLGVMLLDTASEKPREEGSRGRRLPPAICSLLLFVLLAGAITASSTVRGTGDKHSATPIPGEHLWNAGDIEAVAESLFRTHILAFEFTSVLMLVAIVGALYLARRSKEAGPRPGSPLAPGAPSSTSREEAT